MLIYIPLPPSKGDIAEKNLQSGILKKRTFKGVIKTSTQDPETSNKLTSILISNYLLTN